MTVDVNTLVVQPTDLASKVGVTNPSQVQLEAIAEAILDAQADVEGFLNRDGLVPTVVTLTGLTPLLGVDLGSYKAWRESYQFDDDVEVVSYTPVVGEVDVYDVEFKVGFDGPNKRPVVRYVRAHALRGLREDEAYGFPLRRIVNNMSADGQSVGFEPRPTAEGAPGALPTLKSLRQFKRMSIHAGNRANGRLWPTSGIRL